MVAPSPALWRTLRRGSFGGEDANCVDYSVGQPYLHARVIKFGVSARLLHRIRLPVSGLDLRARGADPDAPIGFAQEVVAVPRAVTIAHYLGPDVMHTGL